MGIWEIVAGKKKKKIKNTQKIQIWGDFDFF